MSVSWVVSGHAATYALKKGIDAPESSRAHKPPVQVPNGVRLYFFVDDGLGLPVDQGWVIYRLLMKKLKTPEDYMNIQALPGFREHTEPTVPNYVVTGEGSWIDPESGLLASGIFVMGDEGHEDLRKYYIYPGAPNPAQRAYSLKMFFNDPSLTWQPGDEVYWVACRSRVD
jgi:hypothetical protein